MLLFSQLGNNRKVAVGSLLHAPERSCVITHWVAD